MARKKTTPARRRTRRANNNNSTVKNVGAAVLGGAGGAVVGGLLVRSGISPTTAAVGVTVAGGVASTMAKKGTAMRLATGGAAAAGAGQLALAWLASQGNKGEPPPVVVASEAPGRKRNDAYATDINSAFERAREQLEMEDEAAAFVEDYDEEGMH